MASIGNDANGRKRILFFAPDGKRKTIRLGKASKQTANEICLHVGKLERARITNTAPPAATLQWVEGLGKELAGKLAKAGLVEPIEPPAAVTLGTFLADYIDGRADLKPSSKIVRGQAIRNLNECFGAGRDVRTILPGDADDFKQWLASRKLAPTTIHKRLQNARMFFRAMLRRKLIDENPFEGVNGTAAGIKDRQRFVTRAEIEHVLDACPDHHWRAIVALARYGGLRTPSETLSLRWQDIDWEQGRVTVTSPKTEHHIDGASRVIPLFPELRKLLADSFDLAPEEAVYVVDERFRKAATGAAGWINANLRTHFERIITRAGLTPWPRLFHNLRASRETELVENYPLQVVTAWLGNTPKVALRHYLMTTDEHFAAAMREEGEAVGTTPATAEPNAAQNAAQQVAEIGGLESRATGTAHKKTPVLPGLAIQSDTVRVSRVEDSGFEPLTFWLPAKRSPN